MELGVFSASVAATAVVLLVLLGDFQLGFSQSDADASSYISWDDLKVDDQKIGLNSRDEQQNGTCFIVVDKNGGGDSTTVQGAVDMVPQHNTQRVKIYILPGIYRSVLSKVNRT